MHRQSARATDVRGEPSREFQYNRIAGDLRGVRRFKRLSGTRRTEGALHTQWTCTEQIFSAPK